MDDVAVVLKRVLDLRRSGLPGADRSDLLVDLLGRLESRAQLDALFAGLPDADRMVGRVVEFLSFGDPVARSDEELISLTRAHLQEVAEHARTLSLPTLVKAAEILCEGPVVVSSQQGQRPGVRLTGGWFGLPVADVAAGSMLSSDQMRSIEDYDSELLRSAIELPADHPWGEVATAFYTVTEDDDVPLVSAWLLVRGPRCLVRLLCGFGLVLVGPP